MSTTKDKIYIVIPVHNRLPLTRQCLTSLQNQNIRQFQIIVVDDGSTDGTAEMIGSEFPDVVLLRGDGNLWWTGAINKGVEYALSNAGDGDYVLTLNDDTFVSPDYIETIIASTLLHPGSLIGSVYLNDEGARTVLDAGVRINWLTAKFIKLGNGQRYEDILGHEDSMHEVDVLSGRGTLIPIEVFRNIGLYDAVNLPHYGADYEFSCRARRKGYRLFINYHAIVASKVSATLLSSERSPSRWDELEKSFFSIRSPNCIRFRWNFARLTCPTLYLPFFFIFDFCRVVFGTVRNQLTSKRSSLEK